jgi:putative heme-binding domain-containing protein
LLRSVSPYTISASGDFLQLLFGTDQSAAVQAAAMTALGRYRNPGIPDSLFARWRDLTPAVRNQAITAFLSRTDRVQVVLAALESRRISVDDFSPTQINLLRTFPDPAVSQRAVRILGPFQAKRPAAVEAFQTSLKLPGAPTRGKPNFIARCGACHGVAPGPHPPGYYLDVTPPQKEKLFHTVIEPNASLRPGTEASVIITKNGEIWVGRARNENKQSITLQQANGVEILLPQANVASIHPQPWSIMPEGLERGLSMQDLADLMEYVIQAPALPSENPQLSSAIAQ